MKQLDSAKLSDIKITDAFWKKYIGLISDVALPYQWNMLNDDALPYQWNTLNDDVAGTAPSNCIKNHKIAAGMEEGIHSGVIFIDSDLTKWIEAAAYSIAANPNKQLEEKIDYAVDLIAKTQQDDGYINTYYTLEKPEARWTNLTEGHELYCAGHLIEAAVAYYKATSKDKLLNAAIKFADLLCRVFGPEEGQIKGYPGHQEIELALVRLYKVTGNKKYLDLSMFFIDSRGRGENYFIKEMSGENASSIFSELNDYDPFYSQSHIEPRLQTTAEGHAVRVMYMFNAMAELAYICNDSGLMSACDSVWKNIVTKRMYITGSVGSSSFWERFTVDYDLPNDINYSESCASVGLVLLANKLAQIKNDASYYDVAELALYNTILSAVSLDGEAYFYVNPLEVWPESCITHSAKSHIKPVRQKWYRVACCPANVSRLISSLGRLIYFQGENSINLNMFIANDAKFDFNGTEVRLKLETTMLADGNSSLTVNTEKPVEFDINIRIPEYAKSYTVKLNGVEQDYKNCLNGYLKIPGKWQGRDKIESYFEIEAELMAANPEVRADAGKVAIKRGPVIYCLEEKDNGGNLQSIYVKSDEKLKYEYAEEMLNGTGVIKLPGKKISEKEWNSELYRRAGFKMEDINLKAIPYHLWGNRGENEMLVWIKALINDMV